MFTKEQKRANLNALLHSSNTCTAGNAHKWQYVLTALEEDGATPEHRRRYNSDQRKRWVRIARDNLISLVREKMEI